MSETGNTANKHVDELTLLMYVERQLDLERAQEVSLHTKTCEKCLTLLRALDRESRLLTRSMLEQDEELPARLSEFQATVRRSMQWIWGVVFGLSVLGVYALYAEYIEPWQLQLEQAGFGSTDLLSLLVFQGAFWKGWQSMFTLVEVVAMVSVAGFGLFAVRRYLKRGTALAVMFASMGLLAGFANPASAMEFRKAQSVQVGREESIKGDLFAMGNHIRVEGTVDGDVYGFGEQVEVSGHVTGDVLCLCQGLRISGQVDGNVRSGSNNLTITGSVGRSVSNFAEITTLDTSGKIGYSLTSFTKSLTLDGNLGRDLLGFVAESNVGGNIGGELCVKGDTLNIGSSASIGGKAKFEGNKPADVASGAKLASPIEFKKAEHHSHMARGGGYYIWRVIWTGTFILFGLVLLALMPIFGKETVERGEQYGASFGLGALILFGLPIAAVIACFTVVGFFVGLFSLIFWFVLLMSADVVVGTIIGQWVLGKDSEFWPLILRMAVGIVLVRIVTSVPFVGGWAKFAVVLWGMGAICLALYRRLQPKISPGIPAMPSGPIGTPLPSNTTVGGI